jgi:glycosyltransferase involved in cell wall biosynthesis
MRVVALLATYNEERFIAGCLEHLFQQGADVYLMDNCSSDRTVEIASRYLGKGLVGIETLARNGSFALMPQLRRKEELANSLDADWFMHVDADEIRLPPPGQKTLRQAFEHVEAQGYNAVNFLEYSFVPTREAPDHDHDDFQATMRWYYPFLPRFPHRLNAWKKQSKPIDLVSKAGHRVQFQDLNMYPISFALKHYLVLSRMQCIRKYGNREFDKAEVADGKHRSRLLMKPETMEFPAQAELRTFVSNDLLDATNPRTKHFWVKEAEGQLARK